MRDFYETVSAAVWDITENGYDSEARIEFWVTRLREAAERDTRSPHEMEQMLRRGLGAIWTKLVEKGQIAKHHPGVARFTLEKVRPALRAELDRRIAASANLIKLNRAESIDKTLRRFRGWSTSIPAGGGKADKKESAADIKKALKSLPFEERRVLIDQGHKLTGAISEILATDGGALAGYWNSHWRQAGYDYREDHKERDGKLYAVRGNWAIAAGLMRAGDAGFYDEVTAVAQEPFCRCNMRWVYNLRDLPPEMLTAKGRAKLAEVRGQINRNDSEEATAPPSKFDGMVAAWTRFYGEHPGDRERALIREAADVVA